MLAILPLYCAYLIISLLSVHIGLSFLPYLYIYFILVPFLYTTAAADLVSHAPDATFDEQRQSSNPHSAIQFLLSAALVAAHPPQHGPRDSAVGCRAEKTAFAERVRSAKKW